MKRKFGIWGRLIPFVAVILAVLIFYAVTRSGPGTPFASTAMPYTGPVRYVDTTNGNETANLVNGGTLISTGYHDLFTNMDDNGKIYTISIQEGNIVRKYSDDSGYNFCVFSDYVYYINKSDNNRIYRMNAMDPNMMEKVSDDPASQFCINDVIFYINENDNNRIYRIENDGKNRVRLGTKRAADLFQLYGKVYYLNLDDGGSIWQMTSEGKRNRKLVNDKAGEVFYTMGRLYYINKDDGNKVYSVTDDGKDRKKETDDGADCICSDSSNLLYSNRNDEGRVYKKDIMNGGIPVKLNDDTNCTNINAYSQNLMYVTNGRQKFVNSFNGAPAEKFYPGLDPSLNSGANGVETIQIPEPPPPPSAGSDTISLTPEQEAQIIKTRQQFADYLFADGTAYNGQMKDGLPDGSGTAIAVNGDVYTGSWKAGKREGYGNFQSIADKSMYIGEWVNDKKNGQGRLQKDGETIEGIWKNDEYVGPSGE